MRGLMEVEKLLEGVEATVDNKKYALGGNGGSVEILGGPGIAEGGNGGRGGALGHGNGGDGGGGTLIGSGYARGGDGGDAGRPSRPALGARSTISYLNMPLFASAIPTDIYGIPQPGKGGDSYTAFVEHGNRKYCLNILLQLLSGFSPKIAGNSEIIDKVDELGIKVDVKTEQQWWDLAVKEYPTETSKVMLYIQTCESNVSM